MSKAVLVGAAALAAFLFMGGESKAKTAPTDPSRRMADALASQNAATIRAVAAALRAEGHTASADELDTAAAELEQAGASVPAVPAAVPASPYSPPAAAPVVPGMPSVVLPQFGPIAPGQRPSRTITLPPGAPVPVAVAPPASPTGVATPPIVQAPRVQPTSAQQAPTPDKRAQLLAVGDPAPRAKVLRRGQKGTRVLAWQTVLLEFDPAALPRYGADSDFGGETEGATRKFQTATNALYAKYGIAPISVDGIVGPQSRTAISRRRLAATLEGF